MQAYFATLESITAAWSFLLVTWNIENVFQHLHQIWERPEDPMHNVNEWASLVHASSRKAGVAQFPLERTTHIPETALLDG